MGAEMLKGSVKIRVLHMGKGFAINRIKLKEIASHNIFSFAVCRRIAGDKVCGSELIFTYVFSPRIKNEFFVFYNRFTRCNNLTAVVYKDLYFLNHFIRNTGNIG